MDLPSTSPLQTAAPLPDARKSASTRTRLALCLMIIPTALIVASILLYAVVNFILGATAPEPSADGELFGEQSPVRTTLNVILFFIGSASVAAWLPAMITGIILLATRKK